MPNTKVDRSPYNFDEVERISRSFPGDHVGAALREMAAYAKNLEAEVASMDKAMKVQANAVKTLRNAELQEARIRHQLADEAERASSPGVLASEREANAILTVENERLQGQTLEIDRLKSALAEANMACTAERHGRERADAELKRRIDAERTDGSRWFWMGDGLDHLESMLDGMQVIIGAAQLRALLASAAVPSGWTLVPISPHIGLLSTGGFYAAAACCEPSITARYLYECVLQEARERYQREFRTPMPAAPIAAEKVAS